MSNIINPVLPAVGSERSVDRIKGADKAGPKFSEHLDHRIDRSRRRNEDQLGVKGTGRESAPQKADKGAGSEKTSGSSEQGDVAALVLFLQDLRQVAQEKTMVPGEWRVELPDGEFLADLAEQAGMAPADLAALVEQFQAKNGALDLDAFFQAMIAHFVSFQENPTIVVPETELPLLESLLTKMGLSVEQLESLSAHAAKGNGEIDLALFAQALEELAIGPEGLKAVNLSPWEAEQLQALLDKAGISLGSQLDLLPEQVFGEELILGFERLQALLKATVAQARDNQPKVDLPGFLGSLEQVMRQAAFQDQSVGFSPLIQDSLAKAYQDLLGMYDQARVQYEEGLEAEDGKLQAEIQKWLDGIVARASEQGGSPSEGGKEGRSGFFGQEGQVVENLGAGHQEEFAAPRQGGAAAAQAGSEPTITPPANQPQPVRHFPVQQQQQILNQLSLAVTRGMKSGEQHLVLRLHPADLGEVKVDLTVRNQMVSVSFTMENSKVKETLEGSMEEFRQNMEQKGFSLGDVNVSVGGNQEENDTWQRFEMAWSGERLQAQNLEDVPVDILYRTAQDEQYVSQEKGVNLFV